MTGPKMEYRIVCAHHGQRGHGSHAYKKNTLERAHQEVINANHRAEVSSTDFYRGEAPWHVEQREVVKWETVE